MRSNVNFVIFSESMNMYEFIHVYNIEIYLFENIWMVIFACASTTSQNTTLLRRICNQRVSNIYQHELLKHYIIKYNSWILVYINKENDQCHDLNIFIECYIVHFH
mgnify:CR=1 FL=1